MTVEEALSLQAVEIKVPTFLLAEDPFGAKRPELYVQYIYSPHYLSLVLVLSENNVLIPNEDMNSRPHKEYLYTWESLPDVRMKFRLYLFQNNVEQVGGLLAPAISAEEFLDQAWKFYELQLKESTYKELMNHINKKS